METSVERKSSDGWRTPTAIGVAAGIGAPVGVLLYATAIPFGPVLFGWFVALLGAIIVPGGLCILTTRGHIVVRFSYAVGVAAGSTGAALLAPRGEPDFWRWPLQFATVFIIVSSVSLMAAGLWTLLKWADRGIASSEIADEQSDEREPE